MCNNYETKYHVIYNESVVNDIRIICISDLHISVNSNENNLLNLVKLISGYKPNYICIPGDLLDEGNVVENPKTRKTIFRFFKKLSELCPVILAFGNHDFTIRDNGGRISHTCNVFLKMIAKEKNIFLAHNDTYIDGNILISGFTQPYEYYYSSLKEDVSILLSALANLSSKNDSFLNSVTQDKKIPKLCLMHSPYHLDKKEVHAFFKNYDLILCGHMHNGIVPPFLNKLLPCNKGLISPSRTLFPKYARGMFWLENSCIIVSGGIVKFSNSAPKILQAANVFFPMSIDVIEFTNDYQKVHKTKIYRGKI